MILADTSIWVQHLRSGDRQLAAFVCFIIGGMTLAALGYLHPRRVILAALRDLPQARTAADDEILEFVERQALAGLGIGYVDVHLLAAVRLTADARLWTRDKRLHAVAGRLGLAMT